MKILITSDWYAPTINGVVTSVLNLQRELAGLGHEVRVLTLSPSAHSYRVGSVTYIGAVSAEKIYPGARVRTALSADLLQDLAKWKPDIIHSQCEFSTFRLARKLSAATGAPIVHTYHTVYEDYTHYFSPSRRWGRKAVATFSRWVVAQTAAVIAPTAKVRELLARYEVVRPIHVIPTGIDLDRFTVPRDQAHLTALRRSLGIPDGQFVLSYVGRLAEEKNISELLQNLSDLNRRDVTLLLVGDGPYRGELTKQVAALQLEQQVRFTGMVPPEEVTDYYRLGDLFVSASSSETQGLTYLEALAAGVPALCRRDDCLTGVVTDGVNGWQFRDGEEFRGYVCRFLGDEALRRTMSQNATETALRNFSARAFAVRAAELYTWILERAAGADAA
ncbi:MAG: glycosyltransferase family 4 protein [Oscillibacter sp.]